MPFGGSLAADTAPAGTGEDRGPEARLWLWRWAAAGRRGGGGMVGAVGGPWAPPERPWLQRCLRLQKLRLLAEVFTPGISQDPCSTECFLRVSLPRNAAQTSWR